MLTKLVEKTFKPSDFYAVTAVWWQYTSHIHELHISSDMRRGAYLMIVARVPNTIATFFGHGVGAIAVQNAEIELVVR